MTDASILNDPFMNKGTAFSLEERQRFGLIGALPPAIQTIDQQAERVYEQYELRPDGIQKRKFLMEVFNTNRTLFYHVVDQHIEELLPVIYDPVIAPAIEKYSEIFMKPQGACFLSIDHPDLIKESLANAANGRDIKLIVVTDAEAILGIGDWGTNGVNISVGKLMIYTAAAGIDPKQVLPVSLDVGTDNQKLLDDPLYLGLRHKRIRGDQYYQFIDQFVASARSIFPDVLLHFEDFGRDNATKILKKYQKQIPIFNDDVQGTGMICLAGILAALRVTKGKLTDQRILTYGAGTAGMGIANMIYREMLLAGADPEEAKSHFYLVDRQGLLFTDTPELTPEQKPFTHRREEFPAGDYRELADIIAQVRPTIMIGTSTQPGAFKEQAIKEMEIYTKRPIIFPISNPTELIEAKPEDLIKWTDGQALIATGIPAQSVSFKGVNYKIGQANNALIYPGVGLGVLAVNAKLITDKMLSVSAHALAEAVDFSEPGSAVLPPISEITDFTRKVAEAIAKEAIAEGLSNVRPEDAQKAVTDIHWEAKY